MLGLVFAIINLSNVVPEPVKTPASHIARRAGGDSDFTLARPRESAASIAGIAVVPVCWYGTPRLGRQLWDDAGILSRAFTTPVCANDQMSAFENGAIGLLPFGFGTPTPLLFSPPAAHAGSGPIGLRPAPRRTFEFQAFPMFNRGFSFERFAIERHVGSPQTRFHEVHSEQQAPAARR